MNAWKKFGAAVQDRILGSNGKAIGHLGIDPPEMRERILDNIEVLWSTSRASKPAARAPVTSDPGSSPTCKISLISTSNRSAASSEDASRRFPGTDFAGDNQVLEGITNTQLRKNVIETTIEV